MPSPPTNPRPDRRSHPVRPSAASSQETTYTALSRGRWSNHIYAITETGWQEALATSQAHTFANDQQPTLRNIGHPATRQGSTRERDALRTRLLATRHMTAATAPGRAGRDPEEKRDRLRREQLDQQPHELQQREQGREDGMYIGM